MISCDPNGIYVADVTYKTPNEFPIMMSRTSVLNEKAGHNSPGKYT